MNTPFGRALRKIRIDHDEETKEMAARLGVSRSTFNGMMQRGKAFPADWPDRIASLYGLTEERRAELDMAAAVSMAALTIELDGMSWAKKETAFLLSRKIGKIDKDTALRILDIIGNRCSRREGGTDGD
jgi:plasmid maintenance system antidote protein VapI